MYMYRSMYMYVCVCACICICICICVCISICLCICTCMCARGWYTSPPASQPASQPASWPASQQPANQQPAASQTSRICRLSRSVVKLAKTLGSIASKRLLLGGGTEIQDQSAGQILGEASHIFGQNYVAVAFARGENVHQPASQPATPVSPRSRPLPKWRFACQGKGFKAKLSKLAEAFINKWASLNKSTFHNEDISWNIPYFLHAE